MDIEDYIDELKRYKSSEDFIYIRLITIKFPVSENYVNLHLSNSCNLDLY